jgi:hypothetical protein
MEMVVWQATRRLEVARRIVVARTTTAVFTYDDPRRIRAFRCRVE